LKLKESTPEIILYKETDVTPKNVIKLDLISAPYQKKKMSDEFVFIQDDSTEK
jgi:hypothetical protein